MDADLKPCPFCGENAAEANQETGDAGLVRHSIYCTACMAEGPTTYDPDRAIERWNERASGVTAWREPLSQDPHTQAQAAAVMLLHGTPEQQAEALRACGVVAVQVPAEATPDMRRAIALRFAFDPQQEDLDIAAEAWRAALLASGVAPAEPQQEK